MAVARLFNMGCQQIQNLCFQNNHGPISTMKFYFEFAMLFINCTSSKFVSLIIFIDYQENSFSRTFLMSYPFCNTFSFYCGHGQYFWSMIWLISVILIRKLHLKLFQLKLVQRAYLIPTEIYQVLAFLSVL